jgi:hypothetical protein
MDRLAAIEDSAWKSDSMPPRPKINGAESLVQTLVNGGVNVCFANPGTSEMHFVSALDRVPAF